MSQFIKFYFASSILNMYRTLIHPSSGACDFSIVSPHWLCVLVSACHKVTNPTSHTETPTHIETRTHKQCGETIQKSQAPDDGCINFRNMLRIEEAKWNLINCDIKFVSYSSTITMMRGPIYIRWCNRCLFQIQGITFAIYILYFTIHFKNV